MLSTRPIRVVLALARASLATAMQYRSDFLLDALSGLGQTVAALVPVFLVFSQRETLLGWSPYETTTVVALFLLVHALLGGLVEPNLGEVVEAIRSGDLDLVLMKPADAQLLVSFRRVAPAHAWTAVSALALLAYCQSRIGWPAPADALLALLLLVAGLIAIYGLWVFAICTSFFFVRVDNLRFLIWGITDAGRWPLSVFADWAQVLLVALVPIGVVTTFPALALRGEASLGLVAAGLGSALAFGAGSRWAWKKSLAFYTSASS